MAQYVSTGTLGVLNATLGPMTFMGVFNFTISGTFVGTVELQRSFDAGVTYVPVSKDASGTATDYTAAVSVSIFEPEMGVWYQAKMIAYTSGTATVRLSQ